jgi:Icc-related predicted phosphoesterase
MVGTLKWLGAILLAALIVAAAGLLGPRLAGTTEVSTEFGQVAVRLSPTLTGGMEGYVPVADWGIRFEGPPVPFKVRAELRSLNRDALLRTADGDQSVIDATESQLRNGLRDAVLRNLAWSLAVALALLLLAALIWRSLRPRWVLPLAGLVIFAGATITMGLIARSAVDRNSFDNPTFFASGGELKRILEVIDRTDVDSPYGSEFESIVRSIGAVLATGGEPEAARKEMYLGSDLHANPLVIRPVSRLVGNQPVLMVGDFGQRGSPAESALLAPRVAALGRRVVAVSGNHDSTGLMRKLAADGVTVLGREGTLQPDGSFKPPPVIDVDGVTVAGWADPLEYGGDNPLGNRAVTLDDLDDPEATTSVWIAQMLRWFDSLRQKPDVLMIHQQSLALLLAEALDKAGYAQPLTIATGHTHEQKLEKIGSIVVVNPGTIGAGGAFDAGQQEIGLAHLRFEDDGSLRSAELISVEPFSGAARATRIVIDSLCPSEERCSAVIPDQMVSE